MPETEFGPVLESIPASARLHFLTGPTGVGKSALAVEVAERIGNCEIVSMDSMAVYRGMDIGTAKPTSDLRSRVPHHLIDLVDPHESFSIAQYLMAARDALHAIIARGHTAMFVGGTPLYLKTLLRGASSGPPPDLELRRNLERDAQTAGTESLHARLQNVDPAAAQRIHPRDLRRIVRALEVYERTGEPISALQLHFNRPADTSARVACLTMPRPQLYKRIDARVTQMFRDGLVDEVRRLLRSDPPLGKTARQALGYKEVIDHLLGQVDLSETVALVQRRSRQFAKRQLTWFRSLAECQWIESEMPVRVESVLPIFTK